MAGMSDYLESQLLTHLFRTGSFTKPNTLAIALLTSSSNDAETGSFSGPGVEVPNANGYARQSVNPSDSNWSAASSGNGTTSNLTQIVFPTATGDWGTITGMAVVDSSTYGSGNVLFYADLENSKTINLGDTFRFAPGDLSITLD